MNKRELIRTIQNIIGINLTTTKDPIVYARGIDGQIYNPNEYLKKSDILEAINNI